MAIEPMRASWRSRYLWGPRSALIAFIAIFSLALDQSFKFWMLHDFNIAVKQPIELAPFFDLVMVWNYGISYGLFQQGSGGGRLLLALFAFAVSLGLWVWGVRSKGRVASIAIAFIIGGAIGNGLDRLLYGAVADFFHFHIGDFSWYVFNIADVWIVIGVALLVADGFIPEKVVNHAKDDFGKNGPNDAALIDQQKQNAHADLDKS